MKWYILYTRHHHERVVHTRLLDKGFHAYLPLAMVWRKSNSGDRKVAIPLFPRYVFVRCFLEVYAHLELISLPGVIRILEDTQGRLRIVPEEEIQLLRKLCDADIALERVGYQLQGQFVEVMRGRLRGISGVFRDETKTALLVPIHTLQTSVAVEIDQTQWVSSAAGKAIRRQDLPPESTAER